MPFDQLYDAVHEQRVHIVVSAVTITPERQQTLFFSEPYLDAGMSLAVSAGNSDINSLKNLTGKRVAVLKGTIGEEMALSNGLFKQSEIITYQVNEKRMADLNNGVVDAAIVHFLTTDDEKIKLVGAPLVSRFMGLLHI